MKNIIQILCLLLCFIYSAITHGQATSKKYRLLTYGLQDDVRQNASSIIQAKWGIEFYPVAGCIVSTHIQDSVKRENDKIEKLIEAKYGKTWEEQFEKEIAEEHKVELQIDELVKKQKYIVDKEIESPFPGAPFPMTPIDDKGNYIVSVRTYNEQWEEIKLYKLQVNYKTNLVSILKDFTH